MNRKLLKLKRKILNKTIKLLTFPKNWLVLSMSFIKKIWSNMFVFKMR